jgi:hypothetical protein
MGNQLKTLQNLIALQNLLTQTTVRTNATTTMTPSMVPPIMEDEEEYLGQLPNKFVVIRTTRLQACRKKIEFVARVKAFIHKMDGKKPYWD